MIPTIDPQVKYLGTSYLRTLNSETMKAMEGAVVIQDADAEPLVVILPFATYLRLQSVANYPAELRPLGVPVSRSDDLDQHLETEREINADTRRRQLIHPRSAHKTLLKPKDRK